MNGPDSWQPWLSNPPADQTICALARGRSQLAWRTMTTQTTTKWPTARVLGLIGLILYLITGVFPYLASGLVAPLWGIAVLYAGWLVGLWLTIRLFRSGSAWALVMPVGAVAFWWLVVTLGESLFGWTA